MVRPVEPIAVQVIVRGRLRKSLREMAEVAFRLLASRRLLWATAAYNHPM